MRRNLARLSSLLALSIGFGLLPLSPFAIVSANATTPATITFEETTPGRVTLGELASRSQSKQISMSGSAAPYTMTGTDSRSLATYQIQTDRNYSGDYRLRESDERTPTSESYGRTVGAYFGKSNVIRLDSYGVIPSSPAGFFASNERTRAVKSYGSVFGPQVYSAPFVGRIGQAVSYQFYAEEIQDDYEVYGFLVKINEGDSCTSTGYGTVANHSLLSYGRGKKQDWTTITGNIESNGCYRFRFVSGSYDYTGGTVLGAYFYIANVTIGDAQVITFAQPSDVTGSLSQTVNISVSSNAGDTATAAVTLTSTDTNICTLSSPTSRTVTVLANKTGQICSIRADSAASGSYGPATSVTRSFSIRASATKPVTTGGDIVSGNPLVCSTLSVTEGSWTDGGAAISGTTYQWKKDGSAIIGSTSSTYVVQASDVGSTISFSITKTNSVGSTTANSNSVIILDARMSALGLSAGVLSPTFNGCTFSYSASVSTNSIRVTPTLQSGAATVTVAGSSVVSGQPSGSISLTSGANSISIVVTNGTQTSTTTLTVTYAQAPTVTLLAPTSVTGTGATLNATINANGQNTSNIYLEISTSATFASDTSTVTATPSTATGTSNTSVSAAVTGLVFQTTYYVRAFATNATGTMTSLTYSFTTPAAPFAATSAASDTSTTGVTLNGSVVGNGDVGGTSTTVVFQYSLNSDMSSPIEVSPASNGTFACGDTTTIAVSKSLTGFEAGNTYYFRLKASNNYGTNLGSTLSITLKGAPTVTSAAPTSANIGTTTAKLSGTVDANSDATTAISIRWGTVSGSLGNTLAVTPTTVSGNTSTTVEANMTGLTHSTTYYFILRATNSTGTTDSTQYSFTTNADAVPTATLSAPGNTLLSQPFTVTITFSEVVTGFASEDLSLSGASTNWTAQLAQEVAASSRIFTVEFVPGTGGSIPTAGNFTIGLTSNKVTDSAGQNNTAANTAAATCRPPPVKPSAQTKPLKAMSAANNTALASMLVC